MTNGDLLATFVSAAGKTETRAQRWLSHRQPTEQTQNNNNKESPNCVKKNPKYNPGERVVVGGVGGEGGREGMNPAKSSCNIAKHFFTPNTSIVAYSEVFVHTKICQYLKILFVLKEYLCCETGVF